MTTRVFQTINDRYEDLAERAQDQCEVLYEAMQRITNPEDPSDDAPEELQGILRDASGRAMLAFQSPDTPRQRTLAYVDAILDLASLIQRERVLIGTPLRSL